MRCGDHILVIPSVLFCSCPVVERSICSLPRAAGSCSGWTGRYHYDVIAAKCSHFWYGGCHGNNNNFMTRVECQRACPQPAPVQQAPAPVAPSGGSTSRGSGGSGRATSGGSRSGGSTSGRGRDTGRVFTVQGGSTSGDRQATSAANHAHRARIQLHARRPAPVVQHSNPAAR